MGMLYLDLDLRGCNISPTVNFIALFSRVGFKIAIQIMLCDDKFANFWN
jgi:hypothetical protein